MAECLSVSGAVLTTPRLVLRAFRPEDTDDFYAYASVDGVGQMAGWMPHKNREESREILNGFIESEAVFAITDRSTGCVIGSVGLEKLKHSPKDVDLANRWGRHLGYVLAKDKWGQGLMPEAVSAALRWSFETVGVDYILVGHFIGNDRSRRVIEKLGFRYRMDTVFTNKMGEEKPGKLYWMTREDWEKEEKESLKA